MEKNIEKNGTKRENQDQIRYENSEHSMQLDTYTYISNLIDEINQDITEKDLWEIIAKNSSPEWQKAFEEHELAEKALKDIYKPERMPLGSIGAALESYVTTPLETKLDKSTETLDELDRELKKQKELVALFVELRKNTHVIKLPDNNFSFDNSVAEALDKLFTNEKTEDKEEFSLISVFKSYASKLIKGNKPEAKPSKPNIKKPAP